MTRHTTAAVDSALSLPEVTWAMMADIGVTSATVYVCTGNRFIYATNTYTPVGGFGTIEPVREEADAFPRGLKMTVALVSSQAIYEAFNEQLFNKNVTLYKAVLQDWAVVGTPEIIFKGRINKVSGKVNGTDGSYMELEVESRLRRESKMSFFNRETLWQTYSGDTGANYIERIPLYKSTWGSMPNGVNGGGAYTQVGGAIPFYNPGPYRPARL